MTVSNLKELEALLKLCRRQGVSSISVDGISLQLGDEPKANSRTKQPETKDNIETPDVLSDYDVLTWSAQNG